MPRSGDTQPSMKHQHTTEEKDARKQIMPIFTGRNLMAHNFSSLRLSLAWTVERMAETVLDEISFSYRSTGLRDMSLRLCWLGHSDGIVRTAPIIIIYSCLKLSVRINRPRPAQQAIAIFTLDYAVVQLLLLPTRPLLCVFKLWFCFPFVLVRIERGIPAWPRR